MPNGILHLNNTSTHPSATSGIPQAWREHLECRSCKRSIIEAIGLAYLQKGCSLLRVGHALILAGCFSGENNTWRVSNELTHQLVTEYTTNAMEADSIILRHATQTEATRILVYLPDTDVYNIGLAMLSVSGKNT